MKAKMRPKSWPAMAKAKGREAENAVCQYLKSRGIPAERRRLTGTEDCGDIAGWWGVTVEVKACKAMDLSGWLAEMDAERMNADAKFHKGASGHGLVVIKRRRETNPAKWYALMTLEQAANLIFKDPMR